MQTTSASCDRYGLFAVVPPQAWDNGERTTLGRVRSRCDRAWLQNVDALSDEVPVIVARGWCWVADDDCDCLPRVQWLDTHAAVPIGLRVQSLSCSRVWVGRACRVAMVLPPDHRTCPVALDSEPQTVEVHPEPPPCTGADHDWHEVALYIDDAVVSIRSRCHVCGCIREARSIRCNGCAPAIHIRYRQKFIP